jgi:hypothetical protein
MLTFLDALTIYRTGEAPRKIELYRGDLTALEPAEAVDVLVVSAFRGCYVPSARTLIGALDRRGISVAALAEEKAVDLRDYFSCWLSRDLTGKHPGCGFKRLLCFEPRQDISEVVEHLFQALAPFLGGRSCLSTVAMPLITTGAMGGTIRGVLTPVIAEAVNWMALGFPLRRLKIVEYDKTDQPGVAATVFADLKQQHSRWDAFISYSHQDRQEVDVLANELRSRGLRFFRDSQNLLAGTAWWDEIRNAIRTCSYFVPFYSLDYLRSDTCMSEFSIALASNKPILFPICLCNVADLPPFMTHHHLIVCHKGDKEAVRQAAEHLAAALAG